MHSIEFPLLSCSGKNFKMPWKSQGKLREFRFSKMWPPCTCIVCSYLIKAHFHMEFCKCQIQAFKLFERCIIHSVRPLDMSSSLLCCYITMKNDRFQNLISLSWHICFLKLLQKFCHVPRFVWVLKLYSKKTLY